MVVQTRGTNANKHPGLAGTSTAAPRRSTAEVNQARIEKEARKLASAKLLVSQSQRLEEVTEKAGAEDAAYTTPAASKKRKGTLQRDKSVRDIDALFAQENAEMDNVPMGPPSFPSTRPVKKIPSAKAANTIASEEVLVKHPGAGGTGRQKATPTGGADTGEAPIKTVPSKTALSKTVPSKTASSKSKSSKSKSALTDITTTEDAPPPPAKAKAFDSNGRPIGHRVRPATNTQTSGDSTGRVNATNAGVRAAAHTDTHAKASHQQKLQAAGSITEDSATEDDSPLEADSVTEEDSDTIELKAKDESDTEDFIKSPPKKKAKTVPKVNAKGKAKEESTGRKRQPKQSTQVYVEEESSEVEVVEEIQPTKPKPSIKYKKQLDHIPAAVRPSHQKLDQDKINFGSVQFRGARYVSLPFWDMKLGN